MLRKKNHHAKYLDQSTNCDHLYVVDILTQLNPLEIGPTEVKYKTLNPVWNQSFVISTDDLSTTDAVLELEIRIFDKDQMSADDLLAEIRSRRATALFQPNKKPAAVPSSAIKGNGKSGLSRSSNKGADAGAVSSNKCTVLDNPNPIPNPIPVRPFNRSELVLGINLQRRAIFAFNTKRVRRR